MVLNFEYGINTGNRFLDFVDHDEDPDEFIARQTQPEEKSKKSTKDSKTTSSATSKKSTTKATPTSTTNVTSTTTKANKENVTGKSTNDQRRPQSSISGDNNQQQQQRTDSGRGGGRGFSRRGASSAGQERPAYEGGGRGGGQQRSQRFNRYDGQPGSREPRNFEQSGEVGEGESHPQRFGGYQGRGRGGGDRGRGAPRGTFYNRNYEGGRGRGRGRGGRGSFNNRNIEEGSQPQQEQQQPQQPQLRTQEDNEWHSNTDSSFDNTRSQPVKTENEDSNVDSSLQERSFEPDGTRRGGRGHFRARTFRSNRSYGQEHQYQHDRESGEGGQAEYRHNRRQHDRQPRSYTSTVKPAEKKDGEGAHNWGNATEIPDEQLPTDELDETTEQGASTGKGWAEQVDEAEKKQMTLDEYKKQLEEKKRVNQEKVPQLNRRVAGEGEDQRNWQFKHEYRKKNDDGESGEEEEEEQASDVEEDEDDDSEQVSGKKKLITIPLRFNPVELPRGSPFGSRGGQRRGGGGRFQDRPYRDDQQRSKSPNQQQSPVSPQTGEYHRGGPRQGSGRGEYRRSYGNSARGSRGGYNRSNPNPNTLDLNDTRDFPTLLKQ